MNTDEVRELTRYVSSLPPWLVWYKDFENIHPVVATRLSTFYRYLGQTINAFFTDTSNPLPASGLDEEFQKLIQTEVNFYLSLSKVIFEAEHLIRQEAKAQGYSFVENMRRSDMLKLWIFEECALNVFAFQQDCEEMLPPAKAQERLRECRKSLLGKNSPEKIKLLNQRWAKDDSKLQRYEYPGEISRWRIFCFSVFLKYKRKLSSFNSLVAEMTSVDTMPNQKFAIVNGKYQAYPGRGKAKKAG